MFSKSKVFATLFLLFLLPHSSLAFEPLFDTRIDYNAGYHPRSVVCADLRGDGDLDLIVANVHSHTISILKNNGDGVFPVKNDYYLSYNAYPHNAFCADINGDYAIDVVVSDWGIDSVSILKNNGYGNFTNPVNYAAGDGPAYVFASDLDGDSDEDLAVANWYGCDVSILKNNGNGTFQNPVHYPTGDSARFVSCADLDGDLDLDLAVANTWSNSISILKNNGNGVFQSAVNYGAGKHPLFVSSADLDADGDLDLVVANFDTATISILRNNGDGTFQTEVEYDIGDGSTYIFIEDLDGDLDSDLVAAKKNDEVSILKNNGDGTFDAELIVSYHVGDYPTALFSGDLDGDGDLDLAVANYNSNDISILKNKGHGTFPSPMNYDAGSTPQSVVCANLDGDSDIDLVVANEYSDSISILRNNGNATFQSAVRYYVGDEPNSVYSADLDSDGDMDLAVANYGFGVSILRNNGNGTFQSSVNYPAVHGGESVFCSDFDGDLDLDLAVVNGDSVCLLRNNGDATFVGPINYGAGQDPSSIFCADLDGDGDIDLAVADRYSNNVFILKNKGNGTFETAVNYAVGTWPWSIFCMDVDGDLDLDVITANYLSSDVSILRNNGDGTFQAAVNYTAGGYPQYVFSADLDGDFDFDIVTGNNINSISVLLNNGDGTFGSKVNYGAGSVSKSVSGADLDGDLDIDLAVANWGNNNISVLKNLSNQPIGGTIAGNVKDSVTQDNLAGVLIEALQGPIVKGKNWTNESGGYYISNLAGTYNIRAKKPGYETRTFNGVNISAGQAVIQNFQLNSSPKDTLAYDDFSTQKTVIGQDAQTGMDWQTEGSCIWQVQDGTFRTGATGNRIFCLASSGEPTWTDYIYEADVYGIAGVDKAIEFRVQDYYNHYYVNLRSDWPNPGDDSIYFCKIVNGSCVDYYCVPYPSQNNTWYHLKVEAIGNHFKVYVDDNFALEYVDQENTFPQGKIGLGCWTGDANIDSVRFDPVLVGCWYADFKPDRDGWKFSNSSDAHMWPENWWQQFTNIADKYPYCQYLYGIYKSPVCKPASIFPDWPLWVDVFGKEQCYMDLSGERIIDPVAARVWYDKSREHGGSCFGFSLTASLVHSGLILTGFHGDLHELELNNGTRSLINSYWLHQMGRQYQDYGNNNVRKSPSVTLEEIRQMLEGCITDLRFLAMHGFDVNTGNPKSHSVVPWKVETDPNHAEIQYVYIYDNNDPGELDKKIKIDTQTDWWYYDDQIGVLNIKRHGKGLFLGPPVREFLNRPILPPLVEKAHASHKATTQESNDYLEIYCSSSSDIHLINSIGQEIGNNGDSIYSNFSNGMHVMPYGPFDTNPIGLYVPADSYQLHAENISSPMFYFDIFGDDIAFLYHREVSDTTEIDNLNFSPENKWLQLINSEQVNKSFSFEAITAAPDTYFIFGVDRCDLQFTDSLEFSSPETYSLKISNKGGNKSYDLRVNRVTSEGDSIFVHRLIPMEANSTHTVSPDWTKGRIDSISVYVDSNSDGIIDDTVAVNNQSDLLTGDANGDKKLNVSDVIYLINYLFKGGPAPTPELWIGDVNCDGKVTISDVVYLVNYLFKGGPPPCA